MAEPDFESVPPAPSTPEPVATRGLPQRIRRAQVAQDEVAPVAAARTDPERQRRALESARTCARIADENRGRDILLLDLRQATPLVDYFMLVTAASRRQAAAIAGEIVAEMKRLGEDKLGLEGSEEGRWILIDYGDFVVHVFSEEARRYYALEDIWGDAPHLEWQDPSRPRPPTVDEDGNPPIG